MKNNKGFTLTELLATIVIIGVLSSIGIVSLINLRKNQEIKFNNTQLQVFKQTARTYFTDNRERLPVANGIEIVYLNELIENNYIDKLVDYNKNEYNTEKSYVKVIRVFDKYIYIATLVTGNDEEIIEPSKGQITLTMNSSPNCEGNDNKFHKSCSTTYKMTNIKKYFTNSNIQIQADLNDENKIFAYNYKIYKNNIEMYTSEYIRATGTEKYSDVITLYTDKYDDGKYKIEVYGYNVNNDFIGMATTPDIYIDMTKPTCTRSKNPKAVWTNQDTTVTAVCSDSGSGCKKSQETETIKAEGSRNVMLTVEDKAGNVTECDSIPVRIDKTAPKCETSGESTKWTKENRVLTFKCSDSASGCKTGCETYNSKTGEGGCKESTIQKIITKSAKTLTFSDNENMKNDGAAILVKDYAGNTTKCKSSQNKNSNGNPSSVFNIYVDKEKPTSPEIKGGSDSWKNYAQIIWITKESTSLSGIKKYQYCEKVNGNNCEWKDLNKNGSQVTVSGLDIAYYHSNNSDLITKFNGKTKDLSQHYKDSGQKEGRKMSDKSWLRTAQNFYTEGSSRIYFRAVNNLDTEGDPSNGQTLNIDKTAPTISNISNTSDGNLTCGNVVVGSSATDNLSGVNQIMYSYDNSNWKTDWNTNNISSVSRTWSSKRNNTLYVRACDKAGNCSGSKTTTIHIGVNSASSACGRGETKTDCSYEYKVFTPTCPSGWTSSNNPEKCGLEQPSGNNCCFRSYNCKTTTTYPTCCHD